MNTTRTARLVTRSIGRNFGREVCIVDDETGQMLTKMLPPVPHDFVVAALTLAYRRFQELQARTDDELELTQFEIDGRLYDVRELPDFLKGQNR